MDTKIAVTEEALAELTKSLNELLDSNNHAINSVKRSLDLAEVEGWNDRKFTKFKEDFSQAERYLKEGSQYIEDILLPELRRIYMILEGY